LKQFNLQSYELDMNFNENKEDENNGNNKNVKEARACRTSNRVCEIIVARVDDFLVNTANRRRNKKNMRLRVTKNGQTSATTTAAGPTYAGWRGYEPRCPPPTFSSWCFFSVKEGKRRERKSASQRRRYSLSSAYLSMCRNAEKSMNPDTLLMQSKNLNKIW